MDREIIYILAVVNLTLGFVLVYGCKNPYRGRKRRYMRKPLRGIPPEGLICGLRRPPGRLRLFF